MKLGLYSITYLGLWYRGEALSLSEAGIVLQGAALTAAYSVPLAVAPHPQTGAPVVSLAPRTPACAPAHPAEEGR